MEGHFELGENQPEMASKIEGKDQILGEDEFNRLFDATMGNKWEEVLKAYQKGSSAHKAKLTKSEQTALHIAVASYDTESEGSAIHLENIKKMVESIPKEDTLSVLRLKDVKGNTPLHLAAKLGIASLCKYIASGRWELIAERNNENETPLFLAAHHNKLEAFFLLLKIYNGRPGQGDKQKEERESDMLSLCRGKDGRTVLHSAISGEYFRLAFQIISYYPKLVDSVNVDGESPLHVLARKPNSFKSGSHIRMSDNIIYQCVYVPKLKKENFDDPDTHQNGTVTKSSISYPKNYETCVGLSRLLGKEIPRFFASLSKGYDRRSRTDEENPHNNEKESKEKEGKYDQWPANYATCIRFFKFLLMFLLIIFGIGYRKIKKMREKKERHTWATQIMREMIKIESSYKYYSNGQEPIRGVPMNRILSEPPVSPPEDDLDTSSDVEASKNKGEKERVENGSDAKMKENKKVKKFSIELELNTEKNFAQLTYEKEESNGVKKLETSFLIAAKMGITEMVDKILRKIPVAIHDLDKNDKNALLLAIEHRQTKVFDYLLNRRLPEFVIHQVDNEGNGAHHLAALFRPNQPWRLPGAALQMHGEVTWFKHVKKSLPPLRFGHYNNKGETPRDVFRATHEDLSKTGTEWLIKTSESCSVVAALIATVAFATSATVPGGVDDTSGHPLLVNQPMFNLFSISSLVALCLSLTALVFFLAIITSRCEVWDFKKNLPRRLLMGLSSLFVSIAAILVSFCAGHFFILRENLQYAALPIYAATSVPLTIFACAQLPLYVDLFCAVIAQVPVRSYKVCYR